MLVFTLTAPVVVGASWHRDHRALVLLRLDGYPTTSRDLTIFDFAMNGDLFAVAAGKRLHLLDRSGRVVATRAPTSEAPHWLAVASCGDDGFVVGGGVPLDFSHCTEPFAMRVFGRDGFASAELIGHRDLIHALASTPDGRRCVSAGRDQTVRVWERGAGGWRTLHVLPVAADIVRSLAISRDGSYVAAAVSAANDSVTVWKLDTGMHVRTIPLAGAWSVAFGRGDALFASTCHGRLVALSVSGTRPPSDLSPFTHRPIDTIDVDVSGELLVAGVRWDGDVVVLSADTGRVHRRFDNAHAGDVWRVRFAADGQEAYSAGSDGTLRRWPVYPWWRWRS